MQESYLIDAIRTPRGRLSRPRSNFTGELARMHPVTLGGLLVNAMMERHPSLAPGKIEDLIYATTIAVREQAHNIARYIVLDSRLPPSVSGIHVNRYCSGSLQANAFANASVMAGDYDVVLAGGGEHMNMVPMGADRADPEHLPLTGRIRSKYEIAHQGLSAEIVAEKYGLSQQEIDEYSARSHRRAHAATAAGHFRNEIVPIAYTDPDGTERVLDTDTNIKPDSRVEAMQNLPRPFKEGGKIHAAASSGICDGASLALWASADMVKAHGLKPRARILANANFGVNPTDMLDGVIPGTALALKRAGLAIDDIDRFEINEAFACVPLAWMKAFDVPPEKVNVNGGAIAMGHPLGATGGILLATLINELEREKLRYGLISLCANLGLSGTMVIERIE